MGYPMAISNGISHEIERKREGERDKEGKRETNTEEDHECGCVFTMQHSTHTIQLASHCHLSLASALPSPSPAIYMCHLSSKASAAPL